VAADEPALRRLLEGAPMGSAALLGWTLAEVRRAGLGSSSSRCGSTSTRPPTSPWPNVLRPTL